MTNLFVMDTITPLTATIFWMLIKVMLASADGEASIEEEIIWMNRTKHIIVKNNIGGFTGQSAEVYCREKHKGSVSHINSNDQFETIQKFMLLLADKWQLDTSSPINIRASNNQCVRLVSVKVTGNQDKDDGNEISDQNQFLSSTDDCRGLTDMILCQTHPVSTKQYHVAAGRGKCPPGTEKLATGGVYIGAKQCSSIGGSFEGSPSENQLIQCSLDWCGTDSVVSDGLVMAAINRCSSTPVYRIAIRMYEKHCDVMKGDSEMERTREWQWTNCYFDWCKASEPNRDTYTAAGVGTCRPGTVVGQGLIYTTAAECRVLQGKMFGTFNDWLKVGCILDWCRIGKDCKKTELGTEYNGTVSHTVSGRKCQRWDSQIPHIHTMTNPDYFPEEDISSANNYCRNPNDWTEGPYCLTTDPSTPWELCDVPFCSGFGPEPIDFTTDHITYIFEPGLHNDMISWCQTRYGADTVFIDTVEKLQSISAGLKKVAEISELKKHEIWVAGSTYLPHNHKITDMSAVKPDGVENQCLYLSNWNSTTAQYGGDYFELYATTCHLYRKRFLCQTIDVRYPGFKLDGGVLQKDITEENACRIACVKSCQGAGYNRKTKQCVHHYQQTACRAGKANQYTKDWIHFMKHHCDCNVLLVSGPEGIADEQITSSGSAGTVNLTALARLDTLQQVTPQGVWSGGWIAGSTTQPWIQIDFKHVRYLYAVVTQGLNGVLPGWVTAYRIKYFNTQWLWYREKNTNKVFVGNKDQNTWVVRGFNSPLIATAVRLVVVRWHEQPGLRLDFIGCLAKPPNLALKKPTFQSSLANRGVPDRAVDGYLFTNFKSGNCMQTKKEANPWFAVDLQDTYQITEVKVTSRRGCCANWLSDVTVLVSFFNPAVRYIEKHVHEMDACAHLRGYISNGMTATIHCKHNTVGRFVFLYMRKAKYPMTLCEVEVYGNKEDARNLALRRPAYQSGLTVASASRAVDGNTHSVFAQGSCTRNSAQRDPWWLVQLDDEYTISHVTITNRGDCCGNLLRDFKVLVGYAFDKKTHKAVVDDFSLCKGLKGPRKNGETIRVPCDDDVIGRYVAVLIPGSGQVLSLCEVQVYGEKAPVPTYAGTDDQSKCVFPFLYNGTYYEQCVTEDKDRSWCATTGNYTADKQWGYCQDVRLVHGRHPAEGTVKVLHGERWYGVCDDMWDNSDAMVVCKQLGYSGGKAAYPPMFQQGSGLYGFSEVQCAGNETGLNQCAHIDTVKGHVCRKGEEAGVICEHSLREHQIILGFPVFKRQHTYKWEGGMILLNEITIRHPCLITSFMYYAQISGTQFAIQIWRPISTPDVFLFVNEIVESPDEIGFQKTDVINAKNKTYALLPGDKIGLYFNQKNPIPFDYSTACEHAGILYYQKSATVGLGQPLHFLKKIERNNICRYYSLSLQVKAREIPRLHDFSHQNKLYSLETEKATKEQAIYSCHLKLGQNATLLNIRSASEHQELCDWLSDTDVKGKSFWLSSRLHDLTSSKAFTQWGHCEPNTQYQCLVLDISPSLIGSKCTWRTVPCHEQAHTICQLTRKHDHIQYYVMALCLGVLIVAVTLTVVYFTRKRSKRTRPIDMEPVVRFSFDHGDDEDDDLYKGLDNPSYTPREERSYNEYQELMVKEEAEETLEDMEEVGDAYANCDVVEQNLVEAERNEVSISPTVELSLRVNPEDPCVEQEEDSQ